MIVRIKSMLIVILFFGIGFRVNAAEPSRLDLADSLFADQKYTEAYKIYDEVFKAGQASDGMLLKMAFIQDASDNFEEALFFLDIYYQNSADRHAVGKIEELAKEKGLMGYQYDDLDYFTALFSKFRMSILVLLISIILLLSGWIYIKFKKGEKAYVPVFLQVLMVIFMFVLVNATPQQKGIIVDDLTLLRSGPSAGAEPIEILTKGHKVTVLSQSEVWSKIIWNGDEVYVRNDRLVLI